MLKIVVPEKEYFNEKDSTFFTVKGAVLRLEHSLVSLRKWESKYHKPFLDSVDRTYEEFLDYIRFMDLDEEEHEKNIYRYLSMDDINKILEYIEDPMTASWITEDPSNVSKSRREKITAELIYYWMFTLNISPECENWHLSQLMMLIRVCSIKNAPEKKMNKRQSAEWVRTQNEIRRQKYHTRG